MTFRIGLLSFAFLSCAAMPLLAQPAPPLVVDALEVVGARRYSTAEVIRVSGLHLKQTTTPADLGATVGKMAATGLFKQVNYRYATTAGRTTIFFDIEEADWTTPVVFDNFIWFTDDALVAALKETIPSFDATAPILAGFTELLTGELQRVLKSRGIPGTVTFVPQADLQQRLLGFVFKVSDPAPKLCALNFAGAAAITSADLASALGVTAETEYSRSYLAGASRGTLTDKYRQRGHWRATFSPPTATNATSERCSGAAVTIAVDEGKAYAWERADWIGNAALAAKDLDKLMPLNTGQVANVTAIEEGIRRIRQAYGTRGYILQRASYEPRLTDAPARAVFDVRIEEGPQFRLGSVDFPGLDPKGAEVLLREWRLKAGEIFDASYPDKFFFEVIRPRLRDANQAPGTKLAVDEKARVVNVSFVFGRS